MLILILVVCLLPMLFQPVIRPITVAYSLDRMVTPEQLRLYWSEDFTNFPGQRWIGEQIQFEPVIRNDKVYLRQLGNPDAGSHSIAAESPIFFGAWEFSVLFDGFTTSNQNRVWIWLSVNNPENPTGYGVRIGESGSQKFVRLFKLNGESVPVEILRSNRSMPDGGDEVFVKVERLPNNVWRLGVRGSNDTEYDWSETIYEDSLRQGRHWFGLQTAFTGTRADRFLFGGIRIWQYPIFVTDLIPLSGSRLEIHFSELLPTGIESLFGGGLLIFSDEKPAVSIAEISAIETVLNVNLLEFLAGGKYRINIPAFTNQSTGNSYQGGEYTFKLFDEAGLFDVVINEFTPRPDDLHFVELLNRSDKLINLYGWKFGRQQQFRTLIHPDGEIALKPGDLAVIGITPENQSLPSNTMNIPVSLPAFGQNQDRLWLKTSTEQLVDSISYTAEWVRDLRAGISFERIDPDYASNDFRNWAPSANSIGHTAGSENSHLPGEFTPLELTSARVMSQGFVEVHFNRFINIADARIRIDQEQPTWISWSPWIGDKIHLGFPEPNNWLFQREASIVIDDVSLFGYSGNGESLQSTISQPVNMGDVIINEIMYQPLQNRYSPFSDQSEYIELRNLKPYRIDLTTHFISDTIDKNNSFRSWTHTSDNWYVDASSYAVIYADTTGNWHDSRLHRFFGISDGPNMARSNRSTLGLTSSGRGVYLRNETGSTIDSVYYSPDWHHPLVRDTRGRSLERIAAVNMPGDSGWTTSTAASGGTPGTQNSSDLAIPEDLTMYPGITVTPNPFSPDLDGRDDHALITVVPPSIGYLIRADVYDRNGRLVRNLSRDLIVGSKVTLIWNGRDNSDRLLGTGVYIILIEGHKPGEKIYRDKKTIVLARGSP
jgi:hypothetical protein